MNTVSKFNSKLWFSVSLLLMIELILFYFVKYSNQNLKISEFSISNIGNIFNLITILLLVYGLFLLNRKNISSISNKVIILFVVMMFFSLLMAFISTKISLPGKSVYILSQPLDKLIVGILFVLYQLIVFSFLAYVWVPIFSKSKVSIFKSAINSFAMLFIFLVICFLFITTKNYNTGKWLLNNSQDNLAFVLGAAVWSDNQPSPSLSSRVDRAIELLNNGFADKIFLTGSNAPGELAEATVAFEYAVSRGVDTTSIMMERSTNSTNQQIYFLKNELYKKNNYNEIIIISDGYHLPRVVEICDFYNLDIKVAASNHNLNFKDKFYNNLRESIALFTFWCFAL